MHKSKTIEQTLKAFKKSNKKRRQRMAERAGHLTADQFKAFLEGRDFKTVPPTPSNPINNGDSKPTIHIVSILDISGSMNGGKLNNALIGINSEINELRRDDSVNYIFTFVAFDDEILTRNFRIPIKSVTTIREKADNTTALNQAIGETLELVNNHHIVGEKVLVKVFTDGGENSSQGKYRLASDVARYIKECESKGFTITFVGTKYDVELVQTNLKIHTSNTLVHDNTSRGVADAFATTTMATKSYSNKVLNNEDVLTGFYKQEGTL